MSTAGGEAWTKLAVALFPQNFFWPSAADLRLIISVNVFKKLFCTCEAACQPQLGHLGSQAGSIEQQNGVLIVATSTQF
ncbi:hypothetical protein [Xanthomonas campestris]|uniref:hypothetical protein n=1 Tax=Xanthomonas campestris TaxID=339 RepID=UPI0023791BA9|nr:hypothetical protein [Xanthomonas campestris]WDJ77477.1 hypothetical protein JH282_03000 [Xanthomonas campestris pv. campestris]